MNRDRLLIPLLSLLSLLVAASGCSFNGGPKAVSPSVPAEAEGPYLIVTEADLQSQLMSFADRFSSIISTAFFHYDALEPAAEDRIVMAQNTVYPMAAAFSIAADPDPDVALLDMVTMITLGRMIYQEHWLQQLGNQVEPILQGFQSAEEDIWELGNRVLTPDQQQDLLSLIQEWRQNHPEVLFFASVRFREFVADRSRVKRVEKARGLFKSVENATRQVEEVRLLGERAMYLGTRLPFLTGALMDVWLSRWANNPEAKEMLADFKKLSDLSDRMENVARELPEKIGAERQALIEQAFAKIAEERRNTIEHFLSEEARLRGVLSELRETLKEGDKLIVSTNSLVEQFQPGPSAEEARPFDINDYREAAAEITGTVTQLNTLVGEINSLLNSTGWKELVPQLDEAIDRVGAEGEEIIDYTFYRTVLLILVGMVFYLLARLALHHITNGRSGSGLEK